MRPVTPVLFVVGPTASGKTDLSYELAHLCGGQVINADSAQFYKPLAIGTAKPDWQAHPIKAHLFDICTEPQDFSVVAYRARLIQTIHELHNQGIMPIVVGGSLFYVQSLFFPPHELENTQTVGDHEDFSWDYLYSIDPARAQALHPHDTYRVRRAIEIWLRTGIQPSQFVPTFEFPFPTYLIALNPNRKVLWERIERRSRIMIHESGWIEEAKNVMDTPWESFITEKGFIGYEKIFNFLRQDSSLQNYAKVVDEIIIETRQYAKRQETFLRGFTKKILALKQQQHPLVMHECEGAESLSASSVLSLVMSLQK